MEENKVEVKKSNTVIIIVLALLVVGLLSYIVCDRVLKSKRAESANENNVSETSTNENSTSENNADTSTENEALPDKAFFDEYLYVFMPMHSASNFMKSIDSFSNKDITSYLFWYYVNQGLQKKIQSDQEKNNEEYMGKMYYTVAKSDFDALVYKMFGTRNYEIVETTNPENGVVKIDDNTYQVRSKATGWYAPSSEITNLEVNSTNAVVEYNLLGSAYDGTEGQIVGHLKFYLTKNDSNWNITKIEYSK